MKRVNLVGRITLLSVVVLLVTNSPKAPTSSPIERPALELRYQVLLERDGVLRTVPQSYPFRGGDRIRLALCPSADCCAYVGVLGSSGAAELLYPSPRIDGGDHLLAANREKLVPTEGWFMFDATPGAEELILLASPVPLVDTENSLSLRQIGAKAWDLYIAPHLHRLADITKDTDNVPDELRRTGVVSVARGSCCIAGEEAVVLHRIRLTNH